MIPTREIMLVLWDVLLFLMLAFPRILQLPKLLVLILIAFCILASRTKIRMRKNYAQFIFLWIAYHLLTSAVGIIYGNDIDEILANARFNILLFGVLFIVTNAIEQQEGCLTHTIRTCVTAGLYIGVYNIAIMVFAYTGRDIQPLLNLDATANVGIHIGYSHIVTTNMSMLILVFPFLVFLQAWDKIEKFVNKNILKIAVLVSGVAMILSGRRIVWIIFVGTLAAYIFKTSHTPAKTVRNIFIVILMLAGVYVVLQRSNIFSIDSMRVRLVSAFIRDESLGGESTRFNQMDELTKGFLDKPIFGSGVAAKTSYFRSGRTLTTSSFEMSYNALFFTGGIVGAFLYFGSLLGLGKIILACKSTDRNLSFAIMVTFLSCVFANATNPYFSSSFDFLIMLFLPLVMSEYVLRKKDKIIDSLLCREIDLVEKFPEPDR